MSSLQNIINVSISRQTQVPTRAGFGTGAFISNNATFQGQTKVYASITEVTADAQAGADTASAAAVYFGQKVAPTKLTVIKHPTANQAQISTLVFSADLITANTTVVTIDGTPLSGVPFNTDNATTLTDIATAIQGDAAVTTAVSDGTNTITVTFADFVDHTISAVVSGGASQATVTSAVTTGAAAIQTLTAALTAAVISDNDWYGLGMYSRVDADITEVSAWVQSLTNTNPKLFFGQSDDANILDATLTSDIAYTLQQLARFRTSVWYHSDDAEWLDMGVMGGNLPSDPGSITWAYKTVSSVTPDDLTDTQKNAASGKAANTYSTVSSINITEEGKVADSPFEWIDVIRGADWITANMAADLFTLLVNLPKLPYDSNGLGMVKSTMLTVLSTAQGMGILSIDTQPSVFVPARADISAADLSARTLNNVTFTGTLAGAIQKINIQGTVTL
jgi:hypothetical protein